MRADLIGRDGIARLVGEARDALVPIRVLVNNAAFTASGRATRTRRRHSDKAGQAGGRCTKGMRGERKPDWPRFVGTLLATVAAA